MQHLLLLLLVAVPQVPDDDELARGLQEGIDEAIHHGVEFLLDRQQRDGSWSNREERYGSGQSAFCLYTLLRSGLPADHAAVEAGLTWLTAQEPRTVYSLACHLLALGATLDPAHGRRMEELLERLVDWQRGAWGYPYKHAGAEDGGAWLDERSEPDLSNTQFAALGLRAAWQAGIPVKKKVWEDLIDATLEFQVLPRSVPTAGQEGLTSSGEIELAGFTYRAAKIIRNARQAVRGQGRLRSSATGSMTVAGIATLEIAGQGLGQHLSARDGAKLALAKENALNWLLDVFTVESNPGRPGSPFYYLYGLERVGSLLGRERLGPHDWYREGARALLLRQRRTGQWGGADAEADTCYALLFLTRATAPASGSSSVASVHSSQGDVRLRGTGSSSLVVWITGFGDGIEGPRVERVEYVIDGEVVETVAGTSAASWAGEDYAIRHDFTRTGRHTVTARVFTDQGELTTRGFQVDVGRILGDWMRESARTALANELEGRTFRATASTETRGTSAGDAFDGRQSTAWVAAPDDQAPRLTLELRNSTRADTITLGQADARADQRDHHDRILRAQVRINDDDEYTVEFGADVLQPAVLHLPRQIAIRKLVVTLVEIERGPGPPRGAGFAEILLSRAR